MQHGARGNLEIEKLCLVRHRLLILMNQLQILYSSEEKSTQMYILSSPVSKNSFDLNTSEAETSLVSACHRGQHLQVI